MEDLDAQIFKNLWKHHRLLKYVNLSPAELREAGGEGEGRPGLPAWSPPPVVRATEPQPPPSSAGGGPGGRRRVRPGVGEARFLFLFFSVLSF